MKKTSTVVRIKNLRLRTVIGVYEWEREVKQDVVLNVEFAYDAEKAVRTDRMEETVNYKAVCKKIIEEVEPARFNLIEKLADQVLKIISQTAGVTRASVEVDKPHALRYADSVSVFRSWQTPH
jgi:D-erythro-7,8-dihydroneopterin triphosphate epimerase